MRHLYPDRHTLCQAQTVVVFGKRVRSHCCLLTGRNAGLFLNEMAAVAKAATCSTYGGILSAYGRNEQLVESVLTPLRPCMIAFIDQDDGRHGQTCPLGYFLNQMKFGTAS